MNRPWMPLYVDDYLRDTNRLTTLEHGAYLLLIMEYWRHGELPDDERALARIARLSDREWKAVRGELAKLFREGWRHKRIEAELTKAAELSEKRRGAAEVRYGKTDPDLAEQSAAERRRRRVEAARSRGRHTTEEWQAMVAFFGGKCVSCGRSAHLAKDHVNPVMRGGSDAIQNIQPLCHSCNSRKGPNCKDFRKGEWEEAICSALGLQMQRDSSSEETTRALSRDTIHNPPSPEAREELSGLVLNPETGELRRQDRALPSGAPVALVRNGR